MKSGVPLHIGHTSSICLCIACFVLSGYLVAQTGGTVVTGFVTNVGGTPLAGADVSLLNTGKGTTTDENGRFSLKVDASGKQTLEFSYLGFQTMTTTVDLDIASKSDSDSGSGPELFLNIVLKEAASELDDVTVTGKGKLEQVRDMAYAVSAIETSGLYNTGADLNQVLNRSAGVRIRQDGGLGSDFTFSLNGFSGRQVKFYLDGIPMDNFGSSLTPNNFPVNLAQRIEVYKGVVPISLGADALGGAVNIISRTDPNYLDVSYGFGSFNTHRASLNFAQTDFESGFTLRATAFLNYSDNNYKVKVRPIDLDNGQRQPLQEVERFHDLYRSTTAQIEIGVVGKPYADKLLVGLIASGNDKDIQTGVIMDQVFGARTANSSALIPTLKYKKADLFAEGFDVSLYAAYNAAKNQFIDTARVRYNWFEETRPASSAEFFRTRQENKDYEALVNTNLSYAFNDHHSVSLNYLLTDFKRESDDPENPDNPAFLFPQQLRKQTLGMAYQMDYERFTGTLFSKYYTLDAASFERIFAAAAEDEFQETATDTQNFGYGAAAAYFILPELQAKASFERAYRLPESTELLGDGLFTRRNPDLNPESSYNINLGAKYAIAFNPDNRLDIEGNYILRRAKDFIRLDQSLSQPVDRQFVNIGNVDTNGFEADVNYSWNDRLRVGANLTYQEIVDQQQFITVSNGVGVNRIPNLNFGFKVPNLPSLFGNLNVDYDFSLQRETGKVDRSNSFNIGYSLNYVEEYFLTPNQLGSNNQDNIPTQLSHNLNASYKIKNGKFNISLEVQNVTDADLFDNYLLQKPGRSFFINLRYFLDKQVF